MTPSLKKLKASRWPTLWYNKKVDEMFIVINSKHWMRYCDQEEYWYSAFCSTPKFKQFAIKYWEFIAWL